MRRDFAAFRVFRRVRSPASRTVTRWGCPISRRVLERRPPWSRDSARDRFPLPQAVAQNRNGARAAVPAPRRASARRSPRVEARARCRHLAPVRARGLDDLGRFDHVLRVADAETRRGNSPSDGYVVQKGHYPVLCVYARDRARRRIRLPAVESAHIHRPDFVRVVSDRRNDMRIFSDEDSFHIPLRGK